MQERHPRVWLRSVPALLGLREELRCLRQAGLSALSPPEKDPAGAHSSRGPGHSEEQQERDGAELPGVRGLSQGLAPLDVLLNVQCSLRWCLVLCCVKTTREPGWSGGSDHIKLGSSTVLSHR